MTTEDFGSATFLGLDCGGTRSVALLADAGNRQLARIQAGPANLRLLKDAQLRRHFRTFAAQLPRPSAIGIGMAGARGEADRRRIRGLVGAVWPGIPCSAHHDLETALAAADPVEADGSEARIIVLSGTGSCCYGRSRAGKVAKVGGWGHVLGDKGSGFEIGLRALKAIVYYYDRDGVWPKLGERILGSLQLNEPDDLVGWVQEASKTEVAHLALEVFAAWHQRDRIASDILDGAADSLAQDAAACARRLVKPTNPVRFVLAGSVLLKQPRFAVKVGRLIRKQWPSATVARLQREGAWGGVQLAMDLFQTLPLSRRESSPRVTTATPARLQAQWRSSWTPASMKLSPTEQRNPRSLKLDRLSLGEAISLMLNEDSRIPRALLRERDAIEKAVRLIVRAFRADGRLFYVGAGTSGRLGILDASECPPTFRTSPSMVQGIIAGGQHAVWSAVEGAEDDWEAGARAVQFRGLTKNDVVVGIAASGRTPFVWGALLEAKRIGAGTILVCFNPYLELPRHRRPRVVIAPSVGPEVLTGSTRLKAGTATKIILNLFTTLAMVKMGKVIGNLMVDLNPSNAKLRDRAIRIVQELSGAESARARAALGKRGWVVKDAIRLLTDELPVEDGEGNKVTEAAQQD